MSTSEPEILRPTPRRPSSNASQPSPLLSPHDAGNASSETPSRTQSILNLTSSTLLGIYSPTGYNNDNVNLTPWGTGAETPLLDNSRSSTSLSSLSPRLRRQSLVPSHHPHAKSKGASDVLDLSLRGILLFGIGMGYGLLVRHLHDDRQLAAFQVEGIIKPRNDWRYLVFWGVAGVALGSLLPWVDTLFTDDVLEEALEEKMGKRSRSPPGEEDGELNSAGLFGADWTPVVRSVGAFVGIAFAIRKLPWASTLQASLTLALVNPALWYLIDRSKPGFLLSTTVGLTGTAILLASNPDMMPSPASSSFRNSTFPHTDLYNAGGLVGWGEKYVSRESVEGAIWIMSVLFCSCVCFGNIGRRLALSGGRKEKVAFASRMNVGQQEGGSGRGRGRGREELRRK